MMQIIRSARQMRELSRKLNASDKTIAFVPTMGCLHEGHLSLIQIAKENADAVVVSIFVNPTQFGPGEDFAKYPRTEEADLAACEQAGVDAVFLPPVEELYPEGFSTYVSEELCSQGLCGEFRPGHFRGVATVVLMLFNIVSPDVAVFGQKDAQQVAVLRKMVADLLVPVKIVVAPIAREPDGLARSSRNRYLSDEDRALAPKLYEALLAGKAAAVDAGTGVDARTVKNAVSGHLARFPQFRIQYIALVDAITMRPLDTLECGVAKAGKGKGKILLAIAVHLGATRLIDNLVF
jgi:pantoate--beta-alanine ligase